MLCMPKIKYRGSNTRRKSREFPSEVARRRVWRNCDSKLPRLAVSEGGERSLSRASERRRELPDVDLRRWRPSATRRDPTFARANTRKKNGPNGKLVIECLSGARETSCGSSETCRRPSDGRNSTWEITRRRPRRIRSAINRRTFNETERSIREAPARARAFSSFFSFFRLRHEGASAETCEIYRRVQSRRFDSVAHQRREID